VLRRHVLIDALRLMLTYDTQPYIPCGCSPPLRVLISPCTAYNQCWGTAKGHLNILAGINAGGRWLLQYGTISVGEGVVESCINVLDIHSGQWQPAFREPSSQVMAGQAVVAVKNKLVAFG
jgi:hypothetical protein